MPSSLQVRFIKHSERRRLRLAITAITIISVHGVFLPIFYNKLPQPMRNCQLSGREYIAEVLNCDNIRRCQEVFRMKREVFQFLCSELQNKGGLNVSRHIAVDEKVGMFLWTVARAASNRDVQEHFQHSGDTVSRHFHDVLHAINLLIPEYVKLPSATETCIRITTHCIGNSR